MEQDVDVEHLERSQMGAQFDGEITISAQSKNRLETMGYANGSRTSQTLDEFMDTLTQNSPTDTIHHIGTFILLLTNTQ